MHLHAQHTQHCQLQCFCLTWKASAACRGFCTIVLHCDQSYMSRNPSGSNRRNCSSKSLPSCQTLHSLCRAWPLGIHSALEVGVEHDQSFIVADESHPCMAKCRALHTLNNYGRIVVDSENIINHSCTFSSHVKVGGRSTKNQTLNQISTPCR